MRKFGIFTGLAVSIVLFASVVFGQSIALQPYLTGLSSPVQIVNAKDGTNRMFVVQQRGLIRVVQSGSTTPTDFLNLAGLVSTSGSERGLLGLAFHPQYATNRRFFVYYTRNSDGSIEIAEYETPVGTPNVANPTAVRVIINILHPTNSNHNGGTVVFGPDGYLYAGPGDGGSGNDPPNNGQNINALLGKILRLDINTPVGQVPAYNIPPTNPYAGAIPGADEIFSIGMRNPYRFTFDLGGTNQLWCADVGQGAIEEVDIITVGANYGWRAYEGTNCTGLNPDQCAGGANPIVHTPPIFQYGHTLGRCSVTGGYVYRGAGGALPVGSYVYADYCTGEIFLWNNNTQTMLLDTSRAISSYGEDEVGEIYVVGLGGTVDRLVAAGTPTPTNTPTATPTNTPTATPTATPTNTPTATPTNTPTATPTATPTNTPTATPTNTPTATPTATPTSTPTATPTSTPTATPTPAGFEGDVAPRPDGDGTVLATDVTQLRRFATGLDTPNPATNEGQRADCAPRATMGDGTINSGDVVQGRRYAAALDPLTGADGPPASPDPASESVSSLLGDIYAYFFGREIRIGSTEGRTGQTVTIPIELISQGSEAATGFTLEYDPSVLSNPVVALGPAFESAALTVNSNEAAKGRTGILVDLIEPITYSSEPVRIVYVSFDVSKDSAGGETSLALTGSLAARGTSDAFGESLSTRYTGGKVTIVR